MARAPGCVGSRGKPIDGCLGGPLSPGESDCISLRPEQIRPRRDPTDGATQVAVQNRIFLGEHTENLVRHAALGDLNVLGPRQTEAATGSFATGDRGLVAWGAEAALTLENDT